VVIVDANVFIDAAEKTSPNHAWAVAVLRANAGIMGINQVVYAELLVGSGSAGIDPILAAMGVRRLDLPWNACAIAARAFALFLRRSRSTGQIRRSVSLPDFFIGAHAEATGFEVATSDRSRFAACFPKVRLIA